MPPTNAHLDLIIQSIREIKDSNDALYEIICSGSGHQQPLLARILILEESHQDIKKDLHTIKSFQIQLKTEDRKAQWKILILLITALLGWSSAIFTNVSWSNLAHWLTTIMK